VGEVCLLTPAGPGWLVTGTNGENGIDWGAPGPSQEARRPRTAWQTEAGRPSSSLGGPRRLALPALVPGAVPLLRSRYQAPDRVIRLWELETGRAMAPVPIRSEGVTAGCLAFAPDGRRVRAGGSERTLPLSGLAK